MACEKADLGAEQAIRLREVLADVTVAFVGDADKARRWLQSPRESIGAIVYGGRG